MPQNQPKPVIVDVQGTKFRIYDSFESGRLQSFKPDDTYYLDVPENKLDDLKAGKFKGLTVERELAALQAEADQAARELAEAEAEAEDERE